MCISAIHIILILCFILFRRIVIIKTAKKLIFKVKNSVNLLSLLFSLVNIILNIFSVKQEKRPLVSSLIMLRIHLKKVDKTISHTALLVVYL